MLFNPVVSVLSLLVATVCGNYVSYPRPSIYTKSAHFSLQINGTDMYTVNYAGYDYVQLSMDEGYPTEFRITVTDQPSIDTYSITPEKLPIDAKIEGKDLVFSVVKAHYLIVKINDEKEFVILADPMEKDVPQSKGPGIFNVLDYDADNTGSAITTGIQDAMDAAAKQPGSIVYVPAGLYLMGNLMIKDRTSLYLAGGSVLRFTGNPSDYKTLYNKSDLYDGTWWIQTEVGSTDIKVYGRGTIDGNGFNTRKNKYMAEMLVPVGTTNFIADGIVVRDSSFWAVVPIQSEDLLLTNIKILDRFDVTQDDGIDVCECTNVTIRRAVAIANDDSFSAKTWPYKVGTTVPYPYEPRPLKDVLFEDCLAWTWCYGFKIGQGVWELQDGVTFRNGVIYKAGCGIGIDHRFGSDTAQGITFEDIDIERLERAPGGQAGWLIFFVSNDGQGIGPIKDILVKNIKARNVGSKKSVLHGFNGSSLLEGVTFTDVYIKDQTAPATTLGQMNIDINEFAENIVFANT